MELIVDRLTKTIGKATVLRDVSLEMDGGRIYGLRGKNGSGKTMLMRAICGLIAPTRGAVIIDGEVLSEKLSFPPSVGALIESPGFMPNRSGLKNLEYLAGIRKKIGTEEIVRLMDALGLEPKDMRKKSYRKYSLGMKQKIGIIAALMENPDLIVLDEPINALDEKSVQSVKELLLEHRNRGALIIVSCHDREELEFLSDEVFCIEDGRIIDHYAVERAAKQEQEDRHEKN
jgi:ABC-2 type transport system ATP-binding protein